MEYLIVRLVVILVSIANIELSQEKSLIKYLLDRYECIGTVGRPVHNTTEKIVVSFEVALNQILDLNERDQVLTTNCWSRYSWIDILLQWDPTDYGNITNIRVPVHKIWTPDIILYNFADDRLEWYRNASAVVTYKGEVMWIPQAIFKSSCSIDIRNFPFDIQTCKMKFGSWTYDGDSLDIQFYSNEEVDLKDYVPSNEWDILAHPAKRNVKHYQCCTQPFPDLTFKLVLRRKAAFYNYILVLPCVLLSSLTLVIFWIPPESPAKMILGINIFTAFFVSLLLLSESTPPAAESIPLIGAYYCFNMIMITLSTFLSITVINLHCRGEKKVKVPKTIRVIFVDTLARLFCMRNELIIEEPIVRKKRLQETSGLIPDGRKTRENNKPNQEPRYQTYNFRETNETTFENHRDSSVPNSTPYYTSTPGIAGGTSTLARVVPDSPYEMQREPVPSFYSRRVEEEVKEIRRYLKQLMARLHQKEERSQLMLEWKIVALVLDRLFFFCYLVTSLASLMLIFPRADIAGSD